jgi:hypothetical protein
MDNDPTVKALSQSPEVPLSVVAFADTLAAMGEQQRRDALAAHYHLTTDQLWKPTRGKRPSPQQVLDFLTSITRTARSSASLRHVHSDVLLILIVAGFSSWLSRGTDLANVGKQLLTTRFGWDIVMWGIVMDPLSLVASASAAMIVDFLGKQAGDLLSRLLATNSKVPLVVGEGKTLRIQSPEKRISWGVAKREGKFVVVILSEKENSDSQFEAEAIRKSYPNLVATEVIGTAHSA